MKIKILEYIHQLLKGQRQEGKRIPSVSELVCRYKVVPQTINHSRHLLVQRGIPAKRGCLLTAFRLLPIITGGRYASPCAGCASYPSVDLLPRKVQFLYSLK